MNARLAAFGLSLLLTFAFSGIASPQVVVGVGPGAQPRPGMPQPRDPGDQRPQTGAAVLSGRVTAADSGAPLRRVQVRVTGQELRGARSAITDGDGKFTVAKLPAGRYSVSFTKGGFASMQYGQKRQNQPGKTIDLAEGQTLDRIDMALIRGGVIAGRVVDDFGDPVVEARVQVLQQRWMNGRRRLMNSGRMNQTNDRGEFRLWGLGPGDYYVMASNTDRQMFMDTALASVEAPDPSGYAPTYYPGTTSLDDAQKVTVTAGQEVGGVDFALVTTRLVRVSGAAITSEGRPMANAGVMMFPRSAMEGGGMIMPQGGRTDASGAFTIPNVAPGDYILQARTNRGRGREMDGDEGASASVSVGGEDVKNVMLVATKGVRVSGRVIFEGGVPNATIKENLRVFLPPVENDSPMMFGGANGNAQVTPEGTFEVQGMSGRRTVAVMAGAPWVLKAVRIAGTDVMDSGYEFGKEDVSGVEIVLTSRAPTLMGNVKGENNVPASDYFVLAFTTDESAWQQTNRRRVGMSRPDQNGLYRITSLPAGSYYVVALDDMPDDVGSAELFRTLKDRARRVTLQEGETQALDLVLQAAPGS